ncbi:MAG: hypothetical protein ACRC0C_11080 [Gibbsiella quercinecans]|uniref:hypothetical protein n=1 Tax=Gibbsiella quercinecans TaxID=929813 RepID=UPI003F3E817A
MRALKITFFVVLGAVCGVGLMYALMPVISHFVVGPVHGEDQMSLNLEIFFVGALVLALLGAGIGWRLGQGRNGLFNNRTGMN